MIQHIYRFQEVCDNVQRGGGGLILIKYGVMTSRVGWIKMCLSETLSKVRIENTSSQVRHQES